MSKSVVIGGGCFWCIEAVMQRLKGVQNVQSGYAGGTTPNPTYRQVCTGKLRHAEVVKVEYDPQIINLKEIIYIFMNSHDPTTLNRQNYDVGPQYRSIVLYNNEEQKKIIEQSISQIQKQIKDTIVTQVRKLQMFYKAQPEHQNYYIENPNQGYCRMMIKSKIDKLQKKFGQYLDDEHKGKNKCLIF